MINLLKIKSGVMLYCKGFEESHIEYFYGRMRVVGFFHYGIKSANYYSLFSANANTNYFDRLSLPQMNLLKSFSDNKKIHRYVDLLVKYYRDKWRCYDRKKIHKLTEKFQLRKQRLCSKFGWL